MVPRVFLPFTFGVFLQKFKNWTRQQERFVEVKPVSLMVVKHVEI